MESLPVLDFSPLGIDKLECSVNSEDAEVLAEKIIEALSSIGFVYLTNHGIPDEAIEDFKSLSEEFFALPGEIKKKYGVDQPHGYIGPQTEKLVPGRPADMKESFEGCPYVAGDKWPVEATRFQERFLAFYYTCKKMARRVLYAIALGLSLESDDLFAITPDGTYDSFTNLRMNYYPPLSDDVIPGQLRFGEHTDYGIISLVFQETSGLEVKSPSGGWIKATPVPGAVLINIADMLQRRTSGKLVSTLHRVPIPEEEYSKKCARYTAGFFLHPSPDTVIIGLDKNDQTPPITAKEHNEERFRRANIY